MSELSVQEMIRIREAGRSELQTVLSQLPQKRSKEARRLLEDRIRQLDRMILDLYQRTFEKETVAP